MRQSMAASAPQALIQNVTHLLRARRFMPLFATQFLGAFNDSLFKQAVVLFVTFQLYLEPGEGVPVQRDRAGPVHPALLPLLRAVGPAGRRP